MKSTSISSDAILSASRLSLLKLQTKLVDAQKEVATGRLADVGLSLGYKTGQSISLRQDLSRLQTLTDTNGVVATRLEATQAALNNLVGNAQTFVSQLVAARGSMTNAGMLQEEGQNGLGAFTDTTNTSINGSYLFSGINADVKPLATFDTTPPSPAKQAVINAFQTAFGVAPGDPAAANITAAQMNTFLDGPFAALFDDPAWGTTWSSASDQNIKSRISTSELVQTSVNANDSAFRKMASAYAAVASLGVSSLNENAYQAVIDKAVTLTGSAITDLTSLQSSMGGSQERLSNANDRISIQTNIITTHIGTLEGVDPTEASTKLTSLMTQIETAYAMTARIQQLSILNYLPTP